MRMLICKHLADPVAGLVVSPMGSRALAVFAATGDKGLNLRGTYLLPWRMLEALKAKNFHWYDLGGICHETHPGFSQFKAGLVGKLGWEIEYVGQFQACESTMSNLLVQMGEQLRATYGVVKWRLSQRRWPQMD
jgi:lipid II:glycine glycyltransferase (peptidoglycan interpeptide bridge formation enzyme)